MKKEKDTSKLTPRQQEIFSLILKGMNNKEIAQNLGITFGTAKLMANTVLKKTKCASKNMLIVKYLNK